MKTEVKAKSTSRSEAEHWSSAETTRAKSRKKSPKRGKRCSRAQKDEILHYVKETSVADASSKFDVTETTIYEWQRADKRRNINANGNEPSIKEEDPAAIRDRKILATWREHPGYGPSQIRLALKRKGFKVSVGTVRHIMEDNGYLPPKLKRKERTGRYEANRPRDLYHLDSYHFYVHKQKTCVLFIEDDFSRFISGWAMVPAESAEPVIKCFEQSVQRYGRPEGAMSDRGSAFHSWKGCPGLRPCWRKMKSTTIWRKTPLSTAKWKY